MKKLILGVFVLINFISSAQTDLKGKFIIEPMIGIPSGGLLYGMFLNDGPFLNEESNIELTGSFIQLGGRIEYVAKPKVGIGFEVNYESSGYDLTYLTYNSTTGLNEEAVNSWNQTKLRFIGRFMIHFGENENADWYTGAALGYTQETQRNPENEPTTLNYTLAFMPKFLDKISDPFSARIYLGMRYMFTNNIGMVGEIGFGSGSPFTLGLSVRLN